MSKRKKLALSLAATLLVIAGASVLTLRSSWFADFIRYKIIYTVEESTGGRAEIGVLELDWRHLTIRVRDFVLHGTEPATANPLLRLPALEMRARIFGIDYLGAQNPQVNLIVLPDGSTNIPRPRVAAQTSQKSGLETVVDLAINRFEIEDGLLTYQQKKITFGARGEHLRARLDYNLGHPSYGGSLTIDPLLLTYAGRPPVQVHINIPLTIENGAVTLRGAQLSSGSTNFQASGTLSPGKYSAIQFSANMVLAELGVLLNLPPPRVAGDLRISGRAQLDQNANYAVDGTLSAAALSLRDRSTQISGVTLNSPFHADPHLLSMDALKVHILGADITAKLAFEDLKRLNAQGDVRGLPLSALAAAFGTKRLGYSGLVSGTFAVEGSGRYTALTHLNITAGGQGIPVTGQLNAEYAIASNGALRLKNSFLTLPHSRIGFDGVMNRELDVNLLSSDLNDFLPLAAMPVALEGGGTATVSAKITGNLSAPRIDGHLDVTKFAAQKRVFEHVAADVSASQAGAAVRNGALTGKTLQATFDGSVGMSKWKLLPASPLNVNLNLGKGDLSDLLNLAGESAIPVSGQLKADAHVSGTYGNPQGAATLQVADGKAYGQPFQRFSGQVNLADQLVTLTNLELDVAGGRVNLDGTFQHPRDSFTLGQAQLRISTANLQLANLVQLQRQNLGLAGLLELKASARLDVGKTIALTNLTADVSASVLRVRGQDAGSVTGSARTENGNVVYNLTSNFAGSEIRAAGRTALAQNYATTADASIRGLPVEKALQAAGETAVPARGDLSADAHIAGTLDAPDASLSFALAGANLYREPIDRLAGAVRYSNGRVDVSSLKLDAPAGSLSLTGGLNNGLLNLHMAGGALQLSKIVHVRELEPELSGIVRMSGDGTIRLRDQLISGLNANISSEELHLGKRGLGSASLSAKTTGSKVDLQLDSTVADAQIHGSGQSQLTHGYPLHANLTFANIRYSSLAPLFATEPELNPAFDGLVEGKASVEGPALEPQKLSGRLQLDTLKAGTKPQPSGTGAPTGRTVQIQNDGPVSASLKAGILQIEQFRLQGPHSSMAASGTVDFRDANSPLRLKLDADADLALLQNMSRDFYSSGGVALSASIRGTFAQPLVNGRVELKGANVNYSGSPNGLSNANGLIVLNGTTATIQNLTGESGGGKIALDGFVGFGTSLLNYNLRATASRVRVRYADVSLTSNASLTLTGNRRRSLLGGTVTVQRVAYASSTDVGSILSSASAPPTSPVEEVPSGLLAGMRLDIHVLTAPDLRVVTTYAERLEVTSNLTVRGTVLTPGILGRVNVTNGRLLFFGNTYTVNTGTIDFYNPNSIEPVLNASLETTAQGVDVNIGVAGPMADLKLTYRSDPPLSFEQIVQLLATNTTPSDPTIAAHQPVALQQSAGQMGESAILGQAIANPVASRVQRVFGLTQFKIDPSLSGSNGQPSARVTLQQKIANNITFTYITDVTETNSEIVRVQWDLSSAVSAVALRDFNGNVSVEFFYKFKKR